MTGVHITLSVTDDCTNGDSYGVICVRCNACGRFDKDKQVEDMTRLHEKRIKELEHKKNELKNNIKIIEDKIKCYKQNLK